MAESTIKCVNKIEFASLLTSGYTANITKANDANWVIRSGNVATLRLNIKGVNVSSGSFSSGVLIPEGYRPRFDISFIAGDGSATGQTVGIITAAGVLSGIYFGSTGYLQGTFTYVCS